MHQKVRLMKTATPILLRLFPNQINVLVVAVLVVVASVGAQSPGASANAAEAAPAGVDGGKTSADPIELIRDEGLNRSQVMDTARHLTEVIGPRLTGSPNLKRANEWTRDKLSSYGLVNAHLEAWGPFGRGWTLRRFSAQVTEPQTIPLMGFPRAWTPGFERPLSANVVHLDVTNSAGLAKYSGKLKGAIVLLNAPREINPRFEPLATRLNETNLLRLANAPEPGTQPLRRSGFGASTNRPALAAVPTDRTPSFAGRFGQSTTNLAFCAREGAALVVNGSSLGDGGTFFVTAASVPSASEFRGSAGTNQPRISAWSTNAPAIPPQINLAAEDYNRLVRMLRLGEQLTMTVDLQVHFHDDDLMAYNTIAEIPGSDLREEVVMLGGHLDSWHAGTGATDNAAGVAVCMEAVRILQAAKLQPRRTIRIALWSGEEQGLLGSRAYVAKHLGSYTNQSERAAARSPRDQETEPSRRRNRSGNPPADRKLVRQPGYEKLSAYFNLDNGAGKIRGVHLQGNDGVRPLFRKWLRPFTELGAETLTLSNTAGTDHTSFDAIGLPGFQFIQDPLDYETRTHHSNMDVFDRLQADDLKQASVVMAAFVYQTAMLEEKLPRKPLAD
jgi:hypothetical protein